MPKYWEALSPRFSGTRIEEEERRKDQRDKRLTSFFMWPIKIVVHVFADEWSVPPPKPFQPNLVPEQEDLPEKFAIGERRSVTLYLCCHPACQRRGYRSLTRESETWKGPWVERKKKGEKDKDGGPDIGTWSTNAASWSLLTAGTMNGSFRYLFTEASHRKTIESNREECDRRGSERFFVRFLERMAFSTDAR